jgi:hypothetical protein
VHFSLSFNIWYFIFYTQGPPNDTAQGFEAGWRPIDVDVIAKLPWASLLSHLSAAK